MNETIEISLNCAEATLIVDYAESMINTLKDEGDDLDVWTKGYYTMLTCNILAKISQAIHVKGYELNERN